MQSVRETILQQLVTQLETLGAPVYRSPSVAINMDQSVPIAVALDWLSDEAAYRAMPNVDRVLHTRVTVVYRAHEQSEQKADAVMLDAYRMMMSVVVNGVPLSIAPMGGGRGEPSPGIVEIAETFGITYQHRDSDLSLTG